MDYLMDTKTCLVIIALSLLAVRFVLSVESSVDENTIDKADETDVGGTAHLEHYGAVIQSKMMDIRR